MPGPNLLLTRYKKFKKSTAKDCLQILTLYFFTALVIYKLPVLFGHILFIIFFILFYKSKRDYFWLAFFFVLCTGPGHFFYASETVTLGILPLYRLGAGVNIAATEIFLGIAFLKALIRGKKQRIPLAKPLLLLLFYSLFLFLVSAFVFGATFIRFLKDLRYFLYYFSIIPFSYLVYKEGESEKLLYCIFPFVFLSNFSALYFVLTGDYFIHLFSPGLIKQIALGTQEGGSRFGTSGKGEYLLLLISYIFSFFLALKKIRLKKNNHYLLLIAGTSYVTLILTATRIWFIVFTFIFLITVIVIKKNLKIAGAGLLMAILFSLPYLMVPRINDFVNRSWARIITVFEINREKSIAYKEIEFKKKYRFNKTWEGIGKNPLIGWGSSEQFYKYTGGGDIGNFNLILQAGIIGFLLFLNFWMRFFSLTWKCHRRLSVDNPYRGTILLFGISLIGLLIAHFTTHQVFYIITSQSDSVFIMLFIFLSGYYIKDALRMEYSLAYNSVKGQKEREK